MSNQLRLGQGWVAPPTTMTDDETRLAIFDRKLRHHGFWCDSLADKMHYTEACTKIKEKTLILAWRLSVLVLILIYMGRETSKLRGGTS
jgi:hypothetical protein